MATVDAPYPSKMDDIDGRSIVSIERTSTDVTFRNRDGVDVGTFTIRNAYDISYTECIKAIGAFDSDARDVLVKGWADDTGGNSFYNPSTLPLDKSQRVAWSPDGVYLAVSQDHTTGLIIYKQANGVFTKLTDPAYMINGSGIYAALEWSPDGQYLACSTVASPYVVIYKRSGDVLTKLTNPASLPPAVVTDCSWSSDGVYLVCTHSSLPYITIYKRSGDVFTKLTNPTDLPTSTARQAAFSPGNTYLVVANDSTPGITIYERSGDIFTKQTSTPFGGWPNRPCYAVAWSPNGKYFALSVDSDTVWFYKRLENTFYLQSSVGLPAAIPNDISWSPDSNFIACAAGYFSSPAYLYLVKRVDDAFYRIDLTAPTSFPNGAAWSPDGKYLAIAHRGTPFLTIYKSQMVPVLGVPIRITADPEI